MEEQKCGSGDDHTIQSKNSAAERDRSLRSDAFSHKKELQLDLQAIESKLSEYPVDEHPNFVPELDPEHALQ